MKIIYAGILLVGLGFASALHAQTQAPMSGATLINIEGSVLINQGEQFVTAEDGIALGKDDRVMAMENSAALLKYSDGCDVQVDAATVVTLSEGSPCAGWLVAVETVAPTGSAVGASSAVASSGGISPWVYGAVAVVSSVLIYEEFFDDPSSP